MSHNRSAIRSRTLRAALAAGVTGVALAVAPITASAAPRDIGGAGLGDDYFPNYGNSGYDVSRYAIDVNYRPAGDLLTGTTTITAKATQNLRRFNLDFALPVSRVTVNGKVARYNQDDPHELVVTPKNRIRSGQQMTITVEYAGVPSSVEVDGINPWIKTPDGAVALGEPEISAWWYPANDHP